jgi:biopolymer transport protein ExbD
MREEVLTYIIASKLKNYKVSQELPFSNSGIVMYLKNPKSIYVDEDQVTNEAVIQLLNGNDIMGETTTTRVYLATDAKQQPTDYATVINVLKNGKTLLGAGYFRKECDVTTEFENDLQVTTVEYRFTKLLT